MILQSTSGPDSVAEPAPNSLALAFEKALALHQSGQLDAAQDGYNQILTQQPRHGDALHLMGVLAAQRDAHAQAAEWIAQAIAVDPHKADYHYNLGIALQGLGQLPAAIASYDRAIDLQPGHTNAHTNCGNAWYLLGNFQAALESYEAALALDPADPAIHSNRGNALQSLGQLEQALACYAQALTLAPDFVDALMNQGNALKALKRHAAAAESYRKVIERVPGHVEAHFQYGNVCEATQQWDQALASFDRALALQPRLAQAHYNRGVVLQALQLTEAAIVAYEQAIHCEPLHAKALSNRGVLLQAQQRFDAALHSYTQAIAADPKLSGAYFNRGNTWRDMRRWDDAVADYQAALALDPSGADIHNNCGRLYWQTGDFEAALRSFDLALAADPQYDGAKANKSLVLLLLGDFANAWPLYEWRWRGSLPKLERRHQGFPALQINASLAGKTVLLHCEQGFGDTIQFCRYASAVAALGARVVLEVPRPLLGVMQSLQGVSHLVAEGVDPVSAGESIDFQCPLLSLSLAFQTDLASIPSSTRYLHSQDAKLLAWRKRLGPAQRPRVGLVWSGNTKHQFDRERSIPLQQLLRYLPSGVDYVCLQKEVRASDQAALDASAHIQNFASELNDFDDTAALVECMDWVISVDTSVAHLAGALGKPLCLLLPFVPDWRWLLERETSPWYPSATLYRQKALDDWDSVLTRLRRDIETRVFEGALNKA